MSLYCCSDLNPRAAAQHTILRQKHTAITVSLSHTHSRPHEHTYILWQPATLSEPTPPKQDTISLGKAKKGMFIPKQKQKSLKTQIT